MVPVLAQVDRDVACVRAWGVRGGLDDVAAAVVRLWAGQAWKGRGHDSWAAMFAAEVGDPLRLSRANRVKLHAQLAAGGMSTRAIAVVTGVDHDTVAKDRNQDCRKSDSLEVPSDPAPESKPTIGLDGSVRVTDPVASHAMTQRIVALREGPEHLTWDQIGAAVNLTGSAAHFRWARYRKTTPAHAMPPPVRLPTPDRIAELADTGMTSLQIAAEIGVGPERVRALANRDGIRIAGDINRGKGGSKTIDMPRAVANWLTQVTAALDAADAFMDVDDLDPEQAAEWACQLGEISKRFQALTRKFRNQSNERQAQHG